MKHRTPEEIDQDYHFHCSNIGHKLQTIAEIEAQLDEHREMLPKLKAEMAHAQAKIKREKEKAAQTGDVPTPEVANITTAPAAEAVASV